MAGPGQRAVSQVRIQSGQAQVQYAPTNLAYKIKNLELTPGVPFGRLEVLARMSLTAVRTSMGTSESLSLTVLRCSPASRA